MPARHGGRARALRRNPADAERIISYDLRAHRLNGASLRRQDPIRPVIVHCVRHGARLPVETDGGQHVEAEPEKLGSRREAFLAATDYRVLRFSKRGATTNRRGGREAIVVLVACPRPPCAASGGEGPSP